MTDKSLAAEPWFIETGHMFPAALGTDEAAPIAALACAAIEAVGIDNTVAHTEVKLTPTGPRLVEVNPRPAGNQITELVRRVTGIDLAAVHAQLALGLEPDLVPVHTGVGSAAIAFLLPPRAGTVTEIHGTASLRDDPRVVDHVVRGGHRHVEQARNNNTYLGHVMTVEPGPATARRAAKRLIAGLGVVDADDAVAV